MRIRKTSTLRPTAGFSLPELIIVIAIFIIISSIALFNQSKLSSNVLLTNMAYEIGLAVREAQVYGIGVRSEDDGQTFLGQYGAHFSVEDDTSSRQVVVYGDKGDGDIIYSPGEEKYIYSFTNRRGNRIVALCAGDLPQGQPCAPGAAEAVPWLDVTFRRPNPAAVIYAPSQGGGQAEEKSGRAYIVLNSVDDNDCRVVVVESTGQIRVENSTKGSCVNQ